MQQAGGVQVRNLEGAVICLINTEGRKAKTHSREGAHPNYLTLARAHPL